MKVRNSRQRYLVLVLGFITSAAFLWNFRSIAYGVPITNDDSFESITKRCHKQVPNQYWDVCCQSPDYWQNSSCPYGARQDTSRQFNTAEEGWLYQTLLGCLKGGGNKSSCGAAAAKQFAENFVNQSPGCAAAF